MCVRKILRYIHAASVIHGSCNTIGGTDYTTDVKDLIIDDSATVVQCHIDILDDLMINPCEDDEQFFVRLEVLGGRCDISNGRIPVTIVDDGKAIS